MSQYCDINTLPSGWECKYDNRSGKQYFINHTTKTTTWDDPRAKHKNYNLNHIDCTPPQPTHGSPYHVYPYPSPLPLLHAFQPGPPHQLIMSSNTFSPKALPKQITELVGSRGHGSPLSGGSPIFSRGINLTPKDSPFSGRISQLSTKFQDSLTLNTDTDALVTKISAMFPTVSETHIRILLKKYYNREAVVISALQVEKHPITTPGPVATPPSMPRLHSTAVGVYSALQLAKGYGGNSPQMTPPLSGSPRGSPPLRPSSGASGSYMGSPQSFDTYRNSPRQHSSPKMKLRYIKSLFPKAEETLILDILANEDNNVQKTSEKLKSMGYIKKEIVPPNISTRIKDIDPSTSPILKTPPRIKSINEKALVKEQIQKKYSDVPEQVVSMALESVDWSEERADHILSVAIEEDTKSNKKVINSPIKEAKADIVANDRALMQNKEEDSPKVSQSTSAREDKGLVFRKVHNRTRNVNCMRRQIHNNNQTKKPQTSWSETKGYESEYIIASNGPNPSLAKGAQDHLLLIDYVPWNGSDPELKMGTTCIPKGVEKTLRENNKRSQPCGSNASLRKGPSGLAKGSIYQQINKNKHSLVMALESRSGVEEQH